MKSFSEDSYSRLHAYRWAEQYFRSVDVAEAFVAFLASLDSDEQVYISDNGYRAVAIEFESAR